MEREIEQKVPQATPIQATANRVAIQVNADFHLDDSKIFDLNGEGLKVTVVAVN